MKENSHSSMNHEVVVRKVKNRIFLPLRSVKWPKCLKNGISEVKDISFLPMGGSSLVKNKRPTFLGWSFISYHLSSDDTVSFLRPRRRRAANTRRPLGVDMRSRKPCLLRRLRSDGWNVLFISRYFYIFPSTIWECKGSIFEFIYKIFYKISRLRSK